MIKIMALTITKIMLMTEIMPLKNNQVKKFMAIINNKNYSNNKNNST